MAELSFAAVLQVRVDTGMYAQCPCQRLLQLPARSQSSFADCWMSGGYHLENSTNWQGLAARERETSCADGVQHLDPARFNRLQMPLVFLLAYFSVRSIHHQSSNGLHDQSDNSAL